jgi:hypothetical protein
MTDRERIITKETYSEQTQNHLIGDSDIQRTVEIGEIKTIEKHTITEKIPEIHYETRWVDKRVPVAEAVTSQRTVVTGIQETKQIPVIRFVETTETIPIKRMVEKTVMRSLPVTKLEEVIENIPVKKVIARIEYQQFAETKLVEITENVTVKKFVPVTEYQNVTVTTPVDPNANSDFGKSS